ncbi:putative hemolysin [Acinetobacter soli]|uniref:putative hemolysin n=1 Tax=Acinetobacter soli TaxID=487316 RepID=UPI001D09E133|nr:DUF333 domain-containing protein [Acinetobacter soli]MCB8769567.1 DUF333 domain-containing protein [Acinetobacter soli]
MSDNILFPQLVYDLMKKNLIGTLASSLLFTACTSSSISNTNNIKSTGMPNPASVHCEKIGGKSFTKKNLAGDEFAFCKLSDGSEVDAWELFRSAHQQDHTNFIIHYDATKKQKVLSKIQNQKLETVYILDNLSIIVVSVPQSKVKEIVNEIEKTDGVFGVQEDSVNQLY